MKYLTTVLAAASLCALASTASADTYYKGSLVITAVTEDDPGDCNDGPQVGNRDNAIYHPYKSSEPYASLNYFWTYGGQGMRFNGGPFPNTLTNVSNADSVGHDPWNAVSDPNLDIEVAVTSQTTPAAGTIKVVGRVRNIYTGDTQNGCVVDFVFVGLKN
jgi:hypothetical protein